MSRDALPLWPMPVLVAVVPLVAAHLAWAISMHAGHIPACLPYLEGCTSISRAARHGLGNHLFRLLMLPGALLLTLHWLSVRRWLRISHPHPGAGRSLFLLAPMAGLALAAYVTFLGTDGDIYRWLRQYGAQLYFASVFLAQAVFLKRYREIDGHNHGVARGMLAINLLMLALGVAYTIAANAMADPQAKDAWENRLEWHIGLLMTAWYLLQAIAWRRSGFRLSLTRD